MKVYRSHIEGGKVCETCELISLPGQIQQYNLIRKTIGCFEKLLGKHVARPGWIGLGL